MRTLALLASLAVVAPMQAALAQRESSPGTLFQASSRKTAPQLS